MRSLLRAAKRRLISYPIFPALNLPFRAFDTWRRYIGPVTGNWIRWLFVSRADSNFTYRLTDRCRFNLAASVAGLLKKDFAEIDTYFQEIDSDHEFDAHLRGLWRAHPERYRTDESPLIGRRIVWYAIARATKPKVIIETGVDQGMGAVVLCAALARNTNEGHAGRYYGTDINPNAGFFLQGRYADFGSILYGDSIASLRSFKETVDLFINDSDHSAEYEAAEYEVIGPKLTPNAIILGDNSHVTSKLAEYSVHEGRRFTFLAEEPENHWYRGAGVGVSVSAQKD
jgi:predicted O-methyltransferase YrrM